MLLAGCNGAPNPGNSPSTLAAIVNTQYGPALQALIDGAQRSIAAVQFEFNADADDDAIAQKLGAAVQRGVAVSVILEDSVDDNRPRVDALLAAGVNARLDTATRYTHAKLVVADGAQALFGSTNWSSTSMQKNNEADLLVNDAAVAGWFDVYAQKLMADPDSTPARLSITTPLGTPLQDGDYERHAVELIDGAAQRIWLVVYAMDADVKYPGSEVQGLIKKLAAAKQRGVDVKVVLDIEDPDLGINTMNRESAQLLQAAGIATRFDSPTQVTHAKVLLVDDQAIVGSNNWGYGGFATYHEVGMRTAVPDAVASLADYFTQIWNSGNAPSFSAF